MSDPNLAIQRAQLEEFIEDSATIRAFEALFERTDENASGTVEEAPEDGTPYSREDAAWVSAPEKSTFTSKTGDFTIIAGREQCFAWTVGSSDQTATLPLLSTGVAGDVIEIHKVDSGAGRGEIECNATDTLKLDGVTSFHLLLSQYNHIRIKHMGSYWTITELTADAIVGAGTATDPYLNLTLFANGDVDQGGDNIEWSNGPTRNFNFTYAVAPSMTQGFPDNQTGGAIGTITTTTWKVLDVVLGGYQVRIKGRWRT